MPRLFHDICCKLFCWKKCNPNHLKAFEDDERSSHSVLPCSCDTSYTSINDSKIFLLDNEDEISDDAIIRAAIMDIFEKKSLGSVRRAASCLLEAVHISNPDNSRNKAKALLNEGILALCTLLTQTALEEPRYFACCALSELAYQDSACCMAIVIQPGMLKRIGALLSCNSLRTRFAACRVLYNCAAFCENSVSIIVANPTIVASLAILARQGINEVDHTELRQVAVAAISAMSCTHTSRELLSSDAVLAALASALDGAGGRGVRREATCAWAAVALANLTDGPDPLSSVAHPHRPPPAHFWDAAGVAVQLLNQAVRRRGCWGGDGGAPLRPHALLRALHRLSAYPINGPRLVALSVLEPLAQLLDRAASSRRRRRGRGEGGGGGGKDKVWPERGVVAAAIALAENLTSQPELSLAARESGLASALRAVATGGGGGDGGVGDCCRLRAATAADRAVEARLTAAAALHPRLGAQCLLQALDPAVVRCILDHL